MEPYSSSSVLERYSLSYYNKITALKYEKAALEIETSTRKIQIEELQNENDDKAIKIQILNGRIKELEELISHALNDKRFKIKLAVLSVSIKLFFGLVGVYIAIYKNDVITHALIYAVQHYCM